MVNGVIHQHGNLLVCQIMRVNNTPLVEKINTATLVVKEGTMSTVKCAKAKVHISTMRSFLFS